MQGFVSYLPTASSFLDIFCATCRQTLRRWVYLAYRALLTPLIDSLRTVQVLRAHDKHESNSRPADRFEWCVGRRLRLDVLLV